MCEFGLIPVEEFCIHSGTRGTFPLGNYFQRSIADEQEGNNPYRATNKYKKKN